MLVDGKEYDYITRTSFNQGVLQTTGFVNEENINPPGSWSLGLLQMDFFYRSKPWYAGQFIRKITPKIKISDASILFFTTLLNKQKQKLLSVLVRNVDKTFKETIIKLPITSTKEIDFDFMESFIAELSAYLSVSGLDNYVLTDKERQVLDEFEKLEWKEFNVVDIFNVKNTFNILSSDIIPNSGNTPYLCAGADKNSVSSYISYDTNYLDKGNCVFIGGKTFVVSYQENDFYSNDSHNLALYLKNKEKSNKLNQLYLAACINKSLKHKYSWGNSISNKKIQTDKVTLPVSNNKPNFEIMETFISVIQKLVIKDVVLYSDKKIEAAKKVIQ